MAQIRVDAAGTEYDSDGNLWLSFKIPMDDRKQARAVERVMSEGVLKQQAISFGPYRKKRSLDANAYYWTLVGQLADVMQLTPDEVYRRHIHDIGNYETICMVSNAVKDFAKLWCSGHTGRQIDTRKSKIPGCTTVLAYYGSSDFDTRQMSRLIDNCIQDCKNVGIETMTPEEQSALIKRWGK